MAKHVHCGLGLLKNDVAQQRFTVQSVIPGHVHENDLIGYGSKPGDFDFHGPAGFAGGCAGPFLRYISPILSRDPDSMQPAAAKSAPDADNGRRLSQKTLFYYGLANMPTEVAMIPVAALVPNYYGQDLGVSLVAVANVLLLSRAFDAVSDPIVGWLSDRTPTRWGRRRVWMVAAVPILMLAVYKLFVPESPVTAGYLLGWLMLLWLGWTMLFIPYYAWGAELSPDYHQRTRITGWRAWLGISANASSKAAPWLVGVLFGYAGLRANLEILTIMLLVLIPVTVGLTVFNVPEGKNFLPARVPLLPGLKIMWRNGPFKRLVLAFFVNQFGSAISTVLFVFFIRGVVQDQENFLLFLFIYYGAQLVGIPFWIRIARTVDKHRAWCISLFLFAGFQCIYLLLGPGDFYWMLPVACCTGFCGATFRVLPESMKADVIDLDALESGEDRAAWFFAVWSFAIKVAASLGPAVALWALALTSFNPDPGAVNHPDDLLGLRLLYCFGPASGFALCALIAWNYPLTRKAHAKLRVRLAALRAAG